MKFLKKETPLKIPLIINQFEEEKSWIYKRLKPRNIWKFSFLFYVFYRINNYKSNKEQLQKMIQERTKRTQQVQLNASFHLHDSDTIDF